MSMIIKKKQIVTVTLVLALGTAVFVNWYYSRPQAKSTLDGVTTTAAQESSNLGDAQYVSATTAQTSDDTMANFKVKRDAAHDEAKETLNSVIKDSKSSADAVTKATETLKSLTESIKDEADLENLITAKISKDCLVIIDGDVCQVVVPKGVLTDNVTLQIKELVMHQTKISAKNITIIELNG
jgi:stage III sporulation protein AH